MFISTTKCIADYEEKLSKIRPGRNVTNIRYFIDETNAAVKNIVDLDLKHVFDWIMPSCPTLTAPQMFDFDYKIIKKQKVNFSPYFSMKRKTESVIKFIHQTAMLFYSILYMKLALIMFFSKK